MDLFQEINEAVYNERWAKRWHRYKLVFFAALFSIVLVAGGWSVWRNYTTASQTRSAITFWHGIEQLSENQVTVAQDDFLTLSEGNHQGYAMLAQLNRASIAFATQQFNKARVLFSSLQQKDKNDAVADLSSLIAAYAAVSMEVELNQGYYGRLLETANSGTALSDLAREILALYYLQRGELTSALAEFELLLTNQNLASATRQRVELLTKALKQELAISATND